VAGSQPEAFPGGDSTVDDRRVMERREDGSRSARGGRLGGGLPLWLGFGLVWGIQFNLFGSDQLFCMGSAQRASNDAFSVTMLVTIMLASFLLSVIAQHRSAEIHLELPATLSAVLGILAIGVLPLAVGDLLPCMVVGGLLCGLGFAVLTLSWYRVYAWSPVEGIPRTVAAAFLVGAIVMTGFSLLPHAVAVVLAIVLLALAWLQLRGRPGQASQGSAAAQAPESLESAERKALPVLYSLLALIFLYIAVSQLLYLGNRSFSWYNMYMGLIEILSSAVVLALVWRGRLDDRLVEFSSMLVVAAILVAVPFLVTDLHLVSATASSFCSHAVRVLSAIAFCLLVSRARVDAFTVFGRVEGVMKVPTLIGVAISLPLLRQENRYLTVAVLVMVCVYAVVIALYAILSYSRRDNRSAEETIRRLSEQRNMEFEDFQQELFDRTCDRLAERFQLSQRERDVLEQLIHREPLSRISDRLCLSPNTVKTHTRSIYAKMEVHSKSDLAAVFNTTRKEVMLESEESGGTRSAKDV